MSFSDEFELLLRARYPLIYIPTLEEERVEAAIATVARNQGNRAVYTWDFVDGYQGNPNDAGFGRRNPLQALELVEKLPATAPAILILRDYHRFLEDVRSPANYAIWPVCSSPNPKIWCCWPRNWPFPRICGKS